MKGTVAYDLAVMLSMEPIEEDDPLPDGLLWRPATGAEAWSIMSASGKPDQWIEDLAGNRMPVLEIRTGPLYVYLILSNRDKEET